MEFRGADLGILKADMIPRPGLNHLFVRKTLQGNSNHILRLPSDNGEKKYQAVTHPGPFLSKIHLLETPIDINPPLLWAGTGWLRRSTLRE